jgi:hypothetical protein
MSSAGPAVVPPPADLANHLQADAPPMDLLLPNLRDIQESQLDFITSTLAHEVAEHNSTRLQLQRYLGLYLKNERGLCSERAYCHYLNSIIQELRHQVQKEKTKRIESEEARAVLLRRNLEEYCCVSYRGHICENELSLLTFVEEYDPMENGFASCGERVVVEDQAINAPEQSHQRYSDAIVYPSPPTSMPDLMPVIEWCNDGDHEQQRPESARQASPDMFPMEQGTWEQTSGGCTKRQRSEDGSQEASSKRRKH